VPRMAALPCLARMMSLANMIDDILPAAERDPGGLETIQAFALVLGTHKSLLMVKSMAKYQRL
jgi:hypothetical protein